MKNIDDNWRWLMKKIYLTLSVLGAVIPFSIFIPWVIDNGLDLQLLINEWFVNRISSFFAADFLISWLCFILFLVVDKKRNHVQFWWIPLIGNFLIGLSFALPFYLFLREDEKLLSIQSDRS